LPERPRDGRGFGDLVFGVRAMTKNMGEDGAPFKFLVHTLFNRLNLRFQIDDANTRNTLQAAL
jgi:hypothetical protein